jgi:hypothetical protein
MLSTSKDAAVLAPCDTLPDSELDEIAFALMRRHIAANLRGDVDKVATTARLRRINRLWEDGMAGALRHEIEMSPAG